MQQTLNHIERVDLSSQGTSCCVRCAAEPPNNAMHPLAPKLPNLCAQSSLSIMLRLWSTSCGVGRSDVCSALLNPCSKSWRLTIKNAAFQSTMEVLWPLVLWTPVLWTTVLWTWYFEHWYFEFSPDLPYHILCYFGPFLLYVALYMGMLL